MKRTALSSLIAVLLLVTGIPLHAADFFFKDGDRVVMMGDSITEQYLYSSYVEAWTLTRFPGWAISFINVGIGGDRSTGGNSRFKRDVVSYNPTAMTVDFGMNDGGYTAFTETGFNKYMEGLRGIADQAAATNIRVAWCTPSPVEKQELGPAIKGYNETLEKYSEGVQQIAISNKALFVDQFHPYIAVIDKARESNPKHRISSDAVHPAPAGQSIMAWSIMKAMNFPSLVASVEIDAAAGKVVNSLNCKVDGLKTGPGGTLEFNQLDAALPFCPPEAKEVSKWASILEDLNDYRLRVTGLKDGLYEVRMNGTNVVQCSAADLSKGVNLAASVLTAGPIAEQVNAVWAAIKAKNDYFHRKIFRGVILAQVNIPDFLELQYDPTTVEAKRAAALNDRLTNKMPPLFDAIKKSLVMQPHRVEIVPVTDQK